MILTWLANAASPRPDPGIPEAGPQATAAHDARVDASVAVAFDVERETQRLRQHVTETPGPRRSGRDPFAFASRRVEAPDRRAVPRLAVASTPASSEVAAESPLPLKLIGVAERTTGESLVRTAVLSGHADVLLVGVGDEVMGRYTVAAIAAEAVELTDTATGRVVRLALR